MARPDEVTTKALAVRANTTDRAARDWQQGKPVTPRTAAKLERALAKMNPTTARHSGGRPPKRLVSVLRVLMDGPATVAHLAECIAAGNNAVQLCLRDLKQRGVVTHASPLWAIADDAKARQIVASADERSAA